MNVALKVFPPLIGRKHEVTETVPLVDRVVSKTVDNAVYYLNRQVAC